ncbi:MAG: cyclic nucleotide-binding domain-containing protein [Deltaproteobacteria bacterium]|jgi:CRP-like cAMP-binding protein|nr:cyclic nucleotide-binding domain-containing protein [Deltaproteobacteria bacterium]
MNEIPHYSLCDSSSEDIRQAFNFLSKEEAEELCSYLELREFEDDVIVMQEGASEDYVGFLIEGKLAVKKKTGYWDKHIIIAILEKGAMVGEGGFIDSGPRSSTIVAMEPSRLLALSVQEMEKLIQNNPFLAVKIMKRMLYIMSIRLRKAGERISELL